MILYHDEKHIQSKRHVLYWFSCLFNIIYTNIAIGTAGLSAIVSLQSGLMSWPEGGLRLLSAPFEWPWGTRRHKFFVSNIRRIYNDIYHSSWSTGDMIHDIFLIHDEWYMKYVISWWYIQHVKHSSSETHNGGIWGWERLPRRLQGCARRPGRFLGGDWTKSAGPTGPLCE